MKSEEALAIPRSWDLMLGALLLAALLTILAWFSFADLTFFISDTGLRFVQIRELIAHDWRTFAIDYAGRTFDPDLQHVPYYYAYQVVDGEIFLSVSHFFPLVASFLYAILGRVGLTLLPVVGTVFTAVGVVKLGELGGVGRSRFLLWGSVVATPLLFYSLTLWDHSIAAAFTVWATFVLAKGVVTQQRTFFAVAGSLLVLAFAQRVEVVVYGIAIVAALLLTSRTRLRTLFWLCAGAVAAAVPVALLHYIWVGHPAGIVFAGHIFDYGVPMRYPFVNPLSGTISGLHVTSRLLFYVQGKDPVTFIALLVVIVGSVLLIFSLRRESYRRRGSIYLSFASMAAGYLIWMFYGWHVALVGLLSTFSLFPFSFAFIEGTAEDGAMKTTHYAVYRLILLTAIFFVVGMAAVWPAFGGGQWGSRYLLPAYPLLFFLAFYTYDTYSDRFQRPFKRPLFVVFYGLFFLSIMIQLIGVRYLILHVKNGQVAPRDNLAALPADVILTNKPYLTSMMSSIEGKTFLYVEDEWDLVEVASRLKAAGVDRFAVEAFPERPLSVPEQAGNLRFRSVTPHVFQIE